jgi:polar amino acid transport system permease protein/polar amino acid transport system substrate-binding protein
LSIDKGQTEAGRALGLSGIQTMSNIIIPQAVKNIFPALCNEFIVLIKETAIVGYVGLVDIQKAGDFIKSSTFEAFMPLIATAIIYFVLIKILTLAMARVETALRKSEAR